MGSGTDEDLGAGRVDVRGRRAGERADGFTAARRRVFLDRLAETCSVTEAAEASGTARESIYAARRRDPDFAAAWREALAVGYDAVEARLLRYAIAGGEAGASEGALAGGVRPEIGTPEIGTAEVGTPEIGTTEIGTAEIGRGARRGVNGASDARRVARPGSGVEAQVPAWAQVGLQLLARHRATVEGRRGAIAPPKMFTPEETDAAIHRRLDLLAQHQARQAARQAAIAGPARRTGAAGAVVEQRGGAA